MRALFLPWLLALGACDPQIVDAVERGDVEAAAGESGSGGESGAGGDTGTAGAAGASDATLRDDALLHRYSFDGTGTQVTDSKGGAHGEAIACQLLGDGGLALAGPGSGQYVDLPDGLISGLGDATIEAWITWNGGVPWQRVFDFGDYFLTNNYAYGSTYLFLTPKGVDDLGVLRVGYSLSGAGSPEVLIDGPEALPSGVQIYLGVVVDDSHDELRLYRDAALVGSVAFTGKLSDINDVNDWLGRSQFQADGEFGGTLHEVRIYDAALNTAEIEVSYEAGPDAVFPTP